MNKTNLIALVAVAVMVNGQRFVVQPGEALPPLSEHDARELLAAGAIVDGSHEKRHERAAEFDRQRDSAAFQAEREAIAAANASIAPSPAPAPTPAPAPAPTPAPAPKRK